jgi:hypothetical protein
VICAVVLSLDLLRHAYTADCYFSSDYVPLVNIFGIYFQIRDDYMNLQSTQVRIPIITRLLGVCLGLERLP